jgi:hypothetical protein
MQILRLTLTAALLLAAGPALAKDDTRKLDEFGQWKAYTYGQGANKVCYATAAADRTQGGAKGRDATYLAVTHRPKSPGEVSLIGSYGFKAKADAELQVGAQKHTFFTKENSAWAKQPEADKAIVAQLAKGKEVIILATPAKGPAIVDTITLSGFAKALAAIDKACDIRR